MCSGSNNIAPPPHHHHHPQVPDSLQPSQLGCKRSAKRKEIKRNEKREKKKKKIEMEHYRQSMALLMASDYGLWSHFDWKLLAAVNDFWVEFVSHLRGLHLDGRQRIFTASPPEVILAVFELFFKKQKPNKHTSTRGADLIRALSHRWGEPNNREGGDPTSEIAQGWTKV